MILGIIAVFVWWLSGTIMMLRLCWQTHLFPKLTLGDVIESAIFGGLCGPLLLFALIPIEISEFMERHGNLLNRQIWPPVKKDG